MKDNGWSYNRLERWSFVSKSEWEWMRREHMQDRDLGAVLVCGAGHAKGFIDASLNKERLKESGSPFDWNVRAAFLERPDDPVRARQILASKRIYRFLGELQADGSIQGPLVDQYVADGEHVCNENGIPFSYLDPNSPAGWSWLLSVTNGHPKPFTMVLGNPWGQKVTFPMRGMAGEVSYPDMSRPAYANGKQPRLLTYHDGFPLHCIGGGLHPTLECGSDCALEKMGGSTPVDYFLANRETGFRMAFMAYGPGRMDDPTLHLEDGPVMELGMEYPRWKMSALDIQRIGLRFVEMTRQLTETTLLEVLPREIARRAHILGRYHLSGGSAA